MSGDQQQFNVYLPRTLVRRVKHAAIDSGMSLSKLVEVSLTRFLAEQDRPDRPDRSDGSGHGTEAGELR